MLVRFLFTCAMGALAYYQDFLPVFFAVGTGYLLGVVDVVVSTLMQAD